MGLQVPNPNQISDKQWEFIVNLCLDAAQPIPRRETLSPTSASELIDELVALKKERIAEAETGDTYDYDYYNEGEH